jgi:hypothetical protein
MVIIRTSATDVSIQAVSPELGAHAVKIWASQAGGEASCAEDGSMNSSIANPEMKRPQVRNVKVLCMDLNDMMT